MANDKKIIVSAKPGQDVVTVDLTDDEQAERLEAKKTWDDALPARMFAQLRERRDFLLTETDFYALSDQTMSNEIKSYRQELRDLPSKYNDTTVLGTITWPTKPS